ncbi:cadherin-23-like [Protopterus annectens]|uniref:cadherin-23-like n=1 Tax=Protopterus annectens TaxID=7888 RepID=UPI001CFBD035|nr:cadherin-23-like [Protopterus annectens]
MKSKSDHQLKLLLFSAVCSSFCLALEQIRYSVPEEVEIDYVVGNIAQDLQLQKRSDLDSKIRITSAAKKQYFNINPENGDLCVKERLDRERICETEDPCLLNFKVVIENPLSVYGVEIDIKDINDNAPAFAVAVMTLEISEATSPGTRFSLYSATDRDIGTNALQGYTLSPSEYFSLVIKTDNAGSMRGELVLERELDYEKERHYDLLLTATDGGKPPKSGTLNINISVVDANDNAPVFEQVLYKISIKENYPKDGVVFKLTATDADDGLYGSITYSFSETTERPSHVFKLDPKTGDLLLDGLLDFEERKKYELQVEARDGGGRISHCKVLVDVLDQNDNAPEIRVSSLSSPIPEDTALGTQVAVLEVHDQDSGSNSEVNCYLQEPINFKLVLSFENYFLLVTDGFFDRERVSEYSLKVVATDKGAPPLSYNVTLLIQISDINDNKPLFTQLFYVMYINENNPPGSVISSVEAKDQDEHDNGRVTYSLCDGTRLGDSPVSSYISINSVNGEIYALRSFDYEEFKFFDIAIKAEDSGNPPLSSNVTVKIFILDKNDNAPIILYPPIKQDSVAAGAEIAPRTSEPGYLVTKVVAVDADSGQNAWLTYTFLEVTTQGLFTVGHNNGEIRLTRQIYDKDSLKQTVTVLVKDNGEPSLSSSAIVTVLLTDSIAEAFKDIISISSDAYKESDLTLYLVIAVATVSTLFISIIMILLVIKIRKCINDRLEENFNSNFSVMPSSTFQYTDKAKCVPQIGSYKICSTTDSTRKEFVFSQVVRVQYYLVIVAMKPIVLIFLAFSFISFALGKIRYSIPEEAELGFVVGNIAQDLKLLTRPVLSSKIQITSATKKHFFNINAENGDLYVTDRIDREQICATINPCLLNFKILVENPLSVHEAEITIQDINDNAPTFSTESMSLGINEAVSPGIRFPLNTAKDPDIGTNTLQGYTLSPSEYFSLDIKTDETGSMRGELVLERELDYEKERHYDLILTATDGGKPPKSGTMSINIAVADANDNAPVFELNLYKASIKENCPKGTLVVQLTATDADDGPYGAITYSFSKTTDAVSHLFNLDPATGEIQLKQPLDFEETKYYEMQVQARDGGDLISQCKVLIDVLDQNDNAPEIIVSSLASPIPEDTVPGTKVAIIYALDQDSGENGEVNCQLEGPSAFKLIPSFENYFLLVTNDFLDRETFAEYKIRVTATDRGIPQLSNNITIDIQISDINDNIPTFTEPIYLMYIAENNHPGSIISFVEAKDMDENENGRVSYALLQSNMLGRLSVSSYISVNAVSGDVFALRSFDYEEIKFIDCVIQSEDGGNPPLRSNVTVKIFILDKNDNTPLILYPPIKQDGFVNGAEIAPRTSEPGYLVTKVVAADADSGQNAWLTYKLLEVTTQGLFTVGHNNGEIRLARQIYDKDSLKQTVVVLVKDNGEPSLSSTATVTIFLSENVAEALSDIINTSGESYKESDLTIYLVIAVASVSVLFISVMMILVAIRIRNWRHAKLEEKFTPDFSFMPSSGFQYTGKSEYVHRMDSYRNCSTTDSTRMGNTFSQVGQIRYSIQEEVEVNYVVGNVVRDLGQVLNSKISIITTSKNSFFNINSENGELYVTEKIDRERICGKVDPCLLSFKILVENPLSVYEAEITVLDINDNAPRFSTDTMSLEINEAVSPGIRFPLDTAKDPDIGANTLQGYTISPSEYFSLDIKTDETGSMRGELVLERELDYEKERHYDLILTATDGGKPPKSGTLNVIVSVLDANDNAPVFDQTLYKVSVKENYPKGTLVVHLSATDTDDGPYGVITYSFSKTAGAVTDAFRLDPVTGELCLKQPLDFEETNHYEMQIEAKDGGGLISHCKVLVGVLDQNDNAPEITVSSLSSPIPEDTALGTKVAVIYALDHDSGGNGEVNCHLEDPSAFKLIPSFENYFLLVTNDILDREIISEYNIRIIATDKGIPPLSNSITLSVQISDINDNKPQFTQPLYLMYIKENNHPGSVIAFVEAKDRDDKDNGRVAYSILESNTLGDSPVSSYISINAVSGDVFALRSIDYEEIKFIDCVIQAEDGGNPPLRSNVTVKIFILDINDNSPIILYPLVEKGNIVAGTEIAPRTSGPGYLVTKVVAVDADSGQNAWLTYKILEATAPGLFIVGYNNGEVKITRQIQDKDALKQMVVILVKDNGEPPLSSTATVTVFLSDNIAEAYSDSISVSGESSEGSDITIYLVVAIASVSVLFISVIMILLALRIRNCRNPELEENFYPDFNFMPSSAFQYTEKVTCVPRTCSYQDSSTIDSKRKGYVFSQVSLCYHREIAAMKALLFFSWVFLFTVLSSGQLRYSIQEEVEANHVVGNVFKDLGKVLNSQIRIITASKKQIFNINSENGELYVTERLDRERICGNTDPCLMNFKILVENPLSVYEAEITVLDINDNAPRFSTDTMSLEINEAVSPGTRFSLDTAKDLDIGINTLQGYILSPSEYFSLDIKTGNAGSMRGELVLERELDYEKERHYDLILTATDGGKPPKSGTLNISISVVDVNDNAPVFQQDLYKVSVKENYPKDTVVVQLTATDADDGPYGDITYSFSKATDIVTHAFELDPVSGEVRLNQPLDFEETNQYEMQIEAKDGGGRISQCKVLVVVVDQNDNTPEITVSSLSSPIPEDTALGTKVAVIYALDLDSGENGEVNCYLEELNTFKLISSFENYFLLVTNDFLDREKVSEYSIRILATDKGTPPLSNNITVLVQISDINDNKPQFTQPLYLMYIKENNHPGSVISIVEAKDRDDKDNGRVAYSILESNTLGDSPVSSYISINAVSGDVFALRSFDYEEIKFIDCVIQAEDGGNPPLRSNVTVKIFILDINDNSPIILYPPVDQGNIVVGTEIAPRTSGPGYLVTKVVAVDADSGQNAWLTYKILEATTPGLFSVGHNNGEIKTTRQIHDKDALKQMVVILVKDNGEPPLSSTATVTVFLSDNIAEAYSDSISVSGESSEGSDITIYLVVAIASVSVLFISVIMILLALRIRNCRNPELEENFYPDFNFMPSSAFQYTEKVTCVPRTCSYQDSSTIDSKRKGYVFSQTPAVTNVINCLNEGGWLTEEAHQQFIKNVNTVVNPTHEIQSHMSENAEPESYSGSESTSEDETE